MRERRQKIGRAIASALLVAVFPGSGETADTAVGAKDCAIAAGHDAQNNTITCNFGLTPEQLKELTRAAVAGATEPLLDRIEALSKRLGVTKEATETLLRNVGEQPNIPDDDLTKTLTKFAADYKNLQAQVAAMSTESPLARALVTQAKTEIAAGHLQSAGDLLQKLTKYVATLKGTCTKAEAMGVLIDPKICLPEIMNSEYRDGHLAFTFITQKSEGVAVISFSGYGPDQIHINRDDVMQPIDKIIFTFQGSSDYLKASGSCSFSNPYKGTPSSVSCSATTSEGKFSGEFITDGVSPNIIEADTDSSAQHSTALSKFSEPQILKGQCEPSSHVAEGRIGEDLTKKQSRFFCDVAMIVSFGDDPKHRMIQFVDSQSSHGRALAFAGFLRDANLMDVRNVYLETGRASAAADGGCKMFFDKDVISGIACGAKIDEGERRTVPIVTFTANKTARHGDSARK
jgi:hypothetical protein